MADDPLTPDECRILDVLMTRQLKRAEQTYEAIAHAAGLKPPHVALRLLEGLEARTPSLVQRHVGETALTWSTTPYTADGVEDGCSDD
jgi:hypothetical protein